LTVPGDDDGAEYGEEEQATFDALNVEGDALEKVLATTPTTPAGLIALFRWLQEPMATMENNEAVVDGMAWPVGKWRSIGDTGIRAASNPMGAADGAGAAADDGRRLNRGERVYGLSNQGELAIGRGAGHGPDAATGGRDVRRPGEGAEGKDLEARALDAISKGLAELPAVQRQPVQLDLFH